ncbi:MAG: 3-ketoacyl-ACP reductase [Propionibacteriaceae bacterium]|jgi:NAD(P)-dependent dehydrogenase (short-subunit alcohol dehydrogenase family)|nr:3-ketoacyl-ACP reductase [Propionibacteriaceae bacterium]
MPAVALVTGGSRGIGLGISRRLVSDGFAVAILATSPEPSEAMDGLRQLAGDQSLVRYVRGSVADLEDHQRFIDDAVNAWGRLDVLVNNAGVAPEVRADLLVATPQSFDRVLGINLRGPYFLTQQFANRVIALRGDRPPVAGPGDQWLASGHRPDQPVATIVNLSSISATVVSTSRGDYCLSKAGLGMATQLWAVRLGPEDIVVYEVRPGVIASDMTASVAEHYDALFERGLAPINRWGYPVDVAAAVSMLVAGGTPYSTGEVFHVDGGLHLPRL